MDKAIKKAVERYKVLAGQMKDEELELKQLEKQIKEYAGENRDLFDDNDQLVFDNGVKVAVRRSTKLFGSNQSKELLLAKLGEDYAVIKLDDKAVIEAAAADKALQKQLDKFDLQVSTVETLMLYAQ